MDEGRHYEAPFCSTTQEKEPCVCIVCGAIDIADKRIASYPFAYAPSGWSISSADRGLRCHGCSEQQRVHPEFALNNEVWMTVKSPTHHTNHRGQGDTYQIVKVQRLHTAVQVVQARKREGVVSEAALIPEETPTERLAALRAALRNPMPPGEEEEYDRIADDGSTDAPPRKRRAIRRAFPRDRRSRFRQQGSDIGNAIALGGKLAIANEAGDIMVDIAKEMAKDMPVITMALEHPDGRELAKLLVALSVHSMTAHTNLIPKSEFVGYAAELQMTASSMALFQPRLKALRQHFMKLAEVGERMAEFSATDARIETEEEVEEREAAEEEIEEELADLKATVANPNGPNGTG